MIRLLVLLALLIVLQQSECFPRRQISQSTMGMSQSSVSMNGNGDEIRVQMNGGGQVNINGRQIFIGEDYVIIRYRNRNAIHFDNGVSRELTSVELQRLERHQQRQRDEMQRWRDDFQQKMDEWHRSFTEHMSAVFAPGSHPGAVKGEQKPLTAFVAPEPPRIIPAPKFEP